MNENFVRTMAFERAMGAEDELLEISFSSETAVERYDCIRGECYQEILGHEADNVDLKRLTDLGVLLFNHNAGDVIGPVKEPALDTAQRKCTAKIGFDADEDSQKIRQKVVTGTLKGISVGYRVLNWEIVAKGQKSTCGRFEGPCRIARLWEPYEVSIVSIPADDQVGVGRGLPDDFISVLSELAQKRTAKDPVPVVTKARSLASLKLEIDLLENNI